MRALKVIIIAYLLIFGGLAYSNAQTKNFISLNIRYDSPNDGDNIWDYRKEELCQLLSYYKPAIFGVQEGLDHQLNFIKEKLPSYAMIGVGREDGKKKGEFTPILYDTLLFKLLDSNTFWLSEYEDSISVGWDAALERICTYGLFEDKKNGKKLFIFNTHFDHIGKKARLESVRLILKKIRMLNKSDLPLILMGDLNCEPNSDPIQLINSKLTDGIKASITRLYGPIGTFSGFNNEAILDRRIDYIFVNKLDVLRYRHIDDKRKNNNFISDHLPVLIEIQ